MFDLKEENLPVTVDQLQQAEVCIKTSHRLQFVPHPQKFFQIEVNEQLEQIFLKHCHVDAKLQNIGKVLPNVKVLRTESEKFLGMIENTNKLAEKVSAKVRQLDLARVNIDFIYFSFLYSSKICFIDQSLRMPEESKRHSGSATVQRRRSHCSAKRGLRAGSSTCT